MSSTSWPPTPDFSPVRTVIFFRGLCTYCDDQLHLGPIKFGPMAHHLGRAFGEHNFIFKSVDQMGCGSIAQMGHRALIHLNAMPAPLLKGEIFFLGHSLGGLIARWVARRWQSGKISAIATIASPHHGSQIAEQLAEVTAGRRMLHNLSRLVGYNVAQKQELFRHLYPSVIQEFNRNHPLSDAIPCYSILGALPPDQLSWPLRLLHYAYPLTEPNDGMLELSRQRWGQVIGEFSLDHFSQLGYTLHLNPKSRNQSRAEFTRMVERLVFCFTKEAGLQEPQPAATTNASIT